MQANATQVATDRPSAEAAKSLKDLFCTFYRYTQEQFEAQFLDRCMRYPRLFRLLWTVDRDFFREDLELVRKLGALTNFADCRYEIEEYRRANPPSGLLRRGLKLRLSGQEAIRVSSMLFVNHTLPHRPLAKPAKPLTQAVSSQA